MMKTRESGMPDEQTWDQFYTPDFILDSLGIQNLTGNIADLGCGYGTFSIPASRRTTGFVYAIDIEDTMISITEEKIQEQNITNVIAIQKDFLTDGTGLPDGCCDYVFLFNILHAEQPLMILEEAKRLLISGGKVAVIHWINDSHTPRGPSMSIRPKPEDCQKWLRQSGFSLGDEVINLPPYHYGLIGLK
ncbi:MAG: class I SAM-dependent methyltransferase [Anaerolineae bacterium]|nr:class I SAM-dependent methyltransferase [Anaerolineae bacterium]